MNISLKSTALALLVSSAILTTPAAGQSNDFIDFLEDTISSVESTNEVISRLAKESSELNQVAKIAGLPEIISGVRDMNQRLESLEKLIGSKNQVARGDIREKLRDIAKSSGEMYDNYPSIAKKRKKAFDDLKTWVGKLTNEVVATNSELSRLSKIETKAQARLNGMDKSSREYKNMKLNLDELRRTISSRESIGETNLLSQRILSKELSKLGQNSNDFADFFHRLKLLNLSIRRSIAVDEFKSNTSKALASIQKMPDFEELGEIIKDSLDIFGRIDQEFNNLTSPIPAF